MAATLRKRLFVSDLADLQGKSEDAVRKWLTLLEKDHPGSVERLGKGPRARMYVKLSTLRKVDPDLLERESTAADTIAEIESMQKASARTMRAIRRELAACEVMARRLLAKTEPSTPATEPAPSTRTT